MTDPAAAEAMKAVAAATHGPDTPEAASVIAKPTDIAIRALGLAGPALSLMIMAIVAAIASAPAWRWLGLPEWPDEVAAVRIQALAGIAMALTAILGVVVFRLASGGLKRVEAKAGPAGLTVETGD
ncbi:hypothetical protein GCM10017620_24510 [Brevundimonas intermedia]|uniref:Uncharacterized protein n=1 Tax=Brevundimonas intermedia TaxID=74315 RepID=A0ABQ5TAV0_9CAUL|nr:hypothetical protein [Brevundimonas intermedia]GLK49478.1 hypothetical protein GCM10017620_24510 [Brevundimonas intermedia]